MKIYTSYFANAKNLVKNGIVCVSIARISPGWFQGPKMMNLAPSKKLLFDKSITDEAFEREYEREVCSKLSPAWLRREMERVSQGRDVALLCYEKPGDECHRHTLAKWMNANGFDVHEFGQEKKEVRIVEMSLFDDML